MIRRTMLIARYAAQGDVARTLKVLVFVVLGLIVCVYCVRFNVSLIEQGVLPRLPQGSESKDRSVIGDGFMYFLFEVLVFCASILVLWSCRLCIAADIDMIKRQLTLHDRVHEEVIYSREKKSTVGGTSGTGIGSEDHVSGCDFCTISKDDVPELKEAFSLYSNDQGIVWTAKLTELMAILKMKPKDKFVARIAEVYGPHFAFSQFLGIVDQYLREASAVVQDNPDVD